MGTKTRKHIRAKKRAGSRSNETQRRRFGEAFHLALVGIRAAVIIAARSADVDMNTHLHRHAINPLNELLDLLGGRHV